MTDRKNVVDFAKMGVHRPLTTAEIQEIKPQAAVDRSAGEAPEEVSEKEEYYPHEHKLADNIIMHTAVTTLDFTVEEVLRSAYHAGYKEIIITGVLENGDECVHRTNTSTPRAMWHLVRGQVILNALRDREIIEARDSGKFNDEGEPA